MGDVKTSKDDEPQNNYPKLLVRVSDIEDMEHSPHVHEDEENDLFSLEKINGALHSPDEEDVITDFLLSVASSFTEEKPDGKLEHSPKRNDFEPENEENMTTISEPFSQHSREDGPPSTLEFCTENSKGDYDLLQSEHIKCPNVGMNRVLIDTAAPFESVKAAVSKFGGILDWKVHRVQTLERRKLIEQELEQAQEEIPIYKKQYEDTEAAKVGVLKELDITKRLVEELKLNLERAQTDEQQAKQDAELAKLRVEELDQGIEDEASIASKAQLEVARSRHIAADSELNIVKNELEQLEKDNELLVLEKERAVKKAEVSASAWKEVEKLVEEMMIELIDVKQSLCLAHGAHLEAEEEKIGAAADREREIMKCEKELKEVEVARERLEMKILAKKDKISKLDTDTSSLVKLKSELAAYVETKSELDSEKERLREELEELKGNIEKEFARINRLKMEEASLKLEIERERSEIYAVKRNEHMASALVASLNGDLSEIQAEIFFLQTEGRERQERMTELPMRLQLVAQESDHAKMLAQMACEEWQKQNNDAEQAKAEAEAMGSRQFATEREIESAKASEKLALAAINALKESENDADVQEGIITLSLEEYYALNKRAHEAEEKASTLMASVISQIEMAKQSKSKVLRKLEKVGMEMEAQKDALVVAIHKAEDSKERKICAEQELRMLRAKNEQRRKEYVQEGPNPRLSFENGNLSSNFIHMAHTVLPQKGYAHGNGTEIDSSPEVKGAKKKKKSFFPRIFMFLARRKAHTSKTK